MIANTKIFLAAIFMSSSIFAFAEDISETTSPSDSILSSEKKIEKPGKFKPGDFMLEHIVDNHEWHIITIGHTHISIPLPVIIYSKVSGWHIFMSYKFHHGTEAYKNFIIKHEEPHKGKIVETTSHGEIVPLDLSVTKVVFSLIISVLFILWLFISIANKYKLNPKKAPSGIQSFFEPIILFIRDDIAKPSIGIKHYERFMPYLLTIFFFIWFNNMLGLVPIFPGGVNVTGNIAITMVMALFTFALTTFNGKKHYWMEIFNAPGVPWWLKYPIPLMPIIELMGMINKPLVLMVRLFANITAGHMVILAFVSLIFIFGEIHPLLGYGVSVFSCVFSIFMGLLELLVALIQAYVFTLLSAIYFGLALAEPHGNEHH
jgi:F-type H+-transporting ATPase subunit a